jgi:periplasmic protein TonB
MDCMVSSDHVSRQELVRWVACATVVVAAHGMLGVAVLAHPDEAIDSGSPVVMVELAPIAAAPSQTPSDQAPAPQVQTESEQRVREDVERKEKPPEEQVEEIPARNPEVTLPQQVPDPPKQEQEAKLEQQPQEASHAAAPRSAPVTAALPAAPAPGQIESPTTAVLAAWERTLVAHLERFKHYPPQAAGAQGVINLVFHIDRQGHVLKTRVLRSSGSSALDNEALAMIKRADPLPAPPNGVTDTELSFTIPIRYSAAGLR